MKQIPVSSRIIQALYFSEQRRLLGIRFKSGDERIYKDVPEKIVNEMASSQSPGEYYLKYIRDNFELVKARK